MRIAGRHFRTIWRAENGDVLVIDQTRLPFEFETVRLAGLEEAAHAIRSMMVRGAPLIGATAAYGVALAMRRDPSDAHLAHAVELLRGTRPTAVNLAWALEQMTAALACPAEARAERAFARAAEICDRDVALCEAIGAHGLSIFERRFQEKGRKGPLDVLTHCNAGWLACVDWGTALAPIYKAHDAGLPIHVWVDETRPRNQGGSLTAYELGAHGVPHTIIADNTGGHLMQRGRVDLAIVGTDRTTSNGDVCNKIGTYLKALAAFDNKVPFYVALPSTTIDWALAHGAEIPIEERDARELSHITGRTAAGALETVAIYPPASAALNVGFDVTPARYVTGLITERGTCPASRDGLLTLFPEQARVAA
ncbi:MAG: S-methyl-5-thioribose-1-phosphate isomerase [Rhodospirillaceae bacterium]|nr:S-methyl-5-thioribose-1-phosphate isomerase [Rhodospirillaceae bacterium]